MALVSDALIDGAALRANLPPLDGARRLDNDARAATVARLKEALAQGRAEAERRLRADGHGTLCAQRLSDLQDTIVTAIHDLALSAIYGDKKPEPMVVVAVGGYGRGTLAPGSDIDLLFLLPNKQTTSGERAVELILYVLWDLGLKVGHATRSITDSIRQARTDMTIRTAILEARHVCGERTLYDTLITRFDAEVVKGTGPEFIAAKLAERDERHRQQGTSRYLVEPNVKDGKGGLRDLHTLFWIAKYFYRVRARDDLVAAGVFSKAELQRFRKSEDFLWAVRCHLHFMTGRAEERLSFELQREMALRLGYIAHPGLRDVERFMKHYFIVAKEVGDLTRIFCADLEEHHGKPVPVLNRVFGFGRRRPRTIPGTADFVVVNNRVTVANEKVFERDPVNMVRFFHVADKVNLDFHPEAMQLATRSLRLIDNDLRESPEANRLFVEILISRNQPEVVLHGMNEAGVLGKFIPDFGRIVSMMQFNMYHHYTVDEHLIRAVGLLAEIERGEQAEAHPLASEIFPGLKDRVALYIALFLHDIAKGRIEDHSVAGARVARKLGPRFGLTALQTETVAWLVEHHLTMSIIAQSRDLSDRKTILDFAAVVQTLERMKMLLILTVADIKAVGPGVWNGWKGQLLRTLYYETEPLLTGGHSQVSRDRRVAAAKDELAAALSAWPPDEREGYLARHYPAYWLRVDPQRRITHAEFIRAAEAAGKRLATAVRVLAFEAVTEITVLAPDHPRLLSFIAGACTIAGGNIVDAQIYTTIDGQALDTIAISREFEDDADEERRGHRVGELIEKALSGTLRIPEHIAQRGQKKPTRLKAFTVEPSIVVDNNSSNQLTMIEASGLDRLGLLYDLTRALSDLNLNIASAHISTFGERAVDVFYVTDLVGHKVANAARQGAIRRRLTQIFEGAGTSEPAKAPRRREPA